MAAGGQAHGCHTHLFMFIVVAGTTAAQDYLQIPSGNILTSYQEGVWGMSPLLGGRPGSPPPALRYHSPPMVRYHPPPVLRYHPPPSGFLLPHQAAQGLRQEQGRLELEDPTPSLASLRSPDHNNHLQEARQALASELTPDIAYKFKSMLQRSSRLSEEDKEQQRTLDNATSGRRGSRVRKTARRPAAVREESPVHEAAPPAAARGPGSSRTSPSTPPGQTLALPPAGQVSPSEVPHAGQVVPLYLSQLSIGPFRRDPAAGHAPPGHSHVPPGHALPGHGHVPAGHAPPGHGHASPGPTPPGPAPAGHAPTGHAPAGLAPAGHAPPSHAPAGPAPAGHAPAGHAPAGPAPPPSDEAPNAGFTPEVIPGPLPPPPGQYPWDGNLRLIPNGKSQGRYSSSGSVFGLGDKLHSTGPQINPPKDISHGIPPGSSPPKYSIPE